MRTKRYYEIVETETNEPIAKDLFKVMGSRVSKQAAEIRCGWANNEAGYKKYKIVRGNLIGVAA